MKAYKLMRKMKDGSLSSLFINNKSRIPIGVWIILNNVLQLCVVAWIK